MVTELKCYKINKISLNFPTQNFNKIPFTAIANT